VQRGDTPIPDTTIAGVNAVRTLYLSLAQATTVRCINMRMYMDRQSWRSEPGEQLWSGQHPKQYCRPPEHGAQRGVRHQPARRIVLKFTITIHAGGPIDTPGVRVDLRSC